MERRVHLDWLSDGPRALAVRSGLRGLRCRPVDPESKVARSIRVLPPEASLLVDGEQTSRERRRLRLERTSGRRLATVPVDRDREMWIDRASLGNLGPGESAVPATLALAALTRVLPGRAAWTLELRLDERCLRVRARRGRPLGRDATPSRTLRLGEEEASELSLPRLARWQWLAVGAALADGRPGTPPVRPRRLLAAGRVAVLGGMLVGLGFTALEYHQLRSENHRLELRHAELRRTLEVRALTAGHTP